MRLLDLLYKMPQETEVWIAADPENDSSCIAFSEVGKVRLGDVRGYEVVTFYPENYPAHFCTGISVIVKKTEEL